MSSERCRERDDPVPPLWCLHDPPDRRDLSGVQQPCDAGKIKTSGRFLDQVPSYTVAGGTNSKFGKPAIIGVSKAVVLGRCDHVEPLPVAPPVGGAFKSAH